MFSAASAAGRSRASRHARFAVGMVLGLGAGTWLCSQQGSAAAESKRERIVVVGGGIMGSSAAYHLARRGNVDVTLIDANHPIRSSWGESRIARLAYSDPLYVTMMKRAYQLWDELAADAGRRVLVKTGSVDITKKGSPNMTELIDTYDQLQLPYERFFTPESLAKKYPQIRLQPEDEAVYQESGSLVLADVCVQSATECAEKHGATVVEGEFVTAIDRQKRTVTTDTGRVVPYDKLIITLGPWVNGMLHKAKLDMLPLIASNEQQMFFLPKRPEDAAQYDCGAFPTVIWRDDWPYMLPHAPSGTPGIKIAVHGQGIPMNNAEFVVPEGVTAAALPHDRKELRPAQADDLDENMAHMCRDTLRKYLPGINADAHDTYLRCLYTNVAAFNPDGTPDRDFVVGFHPEDDSVLLGTGFGGEGFKFSIFIGEMLADLACGREPSVAGVRERFAPSRLKLHSK